VAGCRYANLNGYRNGVCRRFIFARCRGKVWSSVTDEGRCGRLAGFDFNFFLMSGCRVVNFEWVCGVKGASCEGKASSSSLCFHVIDSA
jgi:hypothetical protein